MKKMKFDLTVPCSNCPCRSDIEPFIKGGRVCDIADAPSFFCHKTVGNGDPFDGEDSQILPTSQHCAGAMIIHEKNDAPNQMMRIAERIGEYDRTKLDMDAPVFNTFEDMAEACIEKNG